MEPMPFHVESVPTVALTLEAYCQRHNLGERTVRRWLAAGELPGASKDSGSWMIPANAQRQPGAGGQQVATQPAAAPAGTIAMQQVPASLAGQLEGLPAYLHLEDAARLLGIDAGVIVRNADHFGAVRWGDLTPGRRRAWRVPQATVRAIAGL